jgi:hypothetical protein
LQDNPLCVDCKAKGHITAATEAHHIYGRNTSDWETTQFLLSLCHRCHSYRTNNE